MPDVAPASSSVASRHPLERRRSAPSSASRNNTNKPPILPNNNSNGPIYTVGPHGLAPDSETEALFNNANNNTGLFAPNDAFVCYGDRVCLLCEGQLLALTRKFNLTYNQMALLGLLTLCSGGMFGVAGLLIWKKGLLRKRYAALFSDAIYADDDSAAAPGANGEAEDGATTTLAAAAQASGNGTIYGANLQELRSTSKRDNEDSMYNNNGNTTYNTESQRSSIAETVPGSTASVADGSGANSSKDGKNDPRKPVTFRIFEYDPHTQNIMLESVGKPVRFGAQVVVVHAATHRAIRYKPHRGAVTLSKPLKNLHFQKDVMTNLPSLQKSSMYKGVVLKKKPERPQSLTSLLTSRLRSLTFSNTNANANGNGNPINGGPQSLTAQQPQPPPPQQQQQLRHTELPPAPRSMPMSLDIAHSSLRPQYRIRGRPRSDQSPGELSGRRITRAMTTTDQVPPPPLSSSSINELAGGGSQQHDRLYRRFSESCVTLAHDITDSISDSLHRQRDQREEKKRLKQLMKDLPNMSFSHSSGKYFVATIQPVRHKSLKNAAASVGGRGTSGESTTTGSGSGRSSFHMLNATAEESYLRWGAPMSIIADYNGKACGIRPRQYYKDCQLYLTTETSQATIIPLREDGDLQSMAQESTRLLAHIEKRQVQLSVGTYNVWMMPRIVSAFTSVSPKKNTRARLIADVLPPCDVWVFTECFDHRSREILLDKLKAAGYFYFSPTVGHKRLKRENMRKVLNGGVVLASKYPIVTVRIKLFKEACLGADKLADKGVLYCKILKDGLPVHIFSTHLQAWSDPASRAMRRTQMVMIADFIRALGIDEVNDPVLIVGDLNVNYWLNKTDQEYDEMLEIFNARDPSVVISQRNTSGSNAMATRDFKLARQFSFDPRLNALAADGLSTDGSLELLDFVLFSKMHRQPSSAKSWIVPLTTSTPWNWRKQPQFNLSDHYPVVSSFTFDM